jgi:hypothetical protein
MAGTGPSCMGLSNKHFAKDCGIVLVSAATAMGAVVFLWSIPLALLLLTMRIHLRHMELEGNIRNLSAQGQQQNKQA